MNPLRLELDHAPASAARARAAVREHLTDLLAGDPALGALLDDAALVASELVTNSVRYGRAPVVLTVLVVPRGADGTGVAEVVLCCSDRGRWRTRAPAEGGRGLPLVRTVSQSLDVDTAGGTTVTARLVR